MSGSMLRCVISAIVVVSAPLLHADNSQPAPVTQLSYVTALQLAQQHAPQLVASAANIESKRAAAIPATALPDPKLVIGLDNVPATGSDRGRLDRESMTMEKIGVMQEIPNADKRRARAQAASAAIDAADAEHAVERLKVRQSVAAAWLARFYLERRLNVLAHIDHENALLEATVQAQLRSGQGQAADALIPAQENAALADRRDELQQQIAQAKAELARWIGEDAYRPLTHDAPALTLDTAQLHRQFHRHPELALYTPRSELAEAQLRKAQAEKKSDWGVEFDYQRREPPLDDMVSLNFTFDLPLFSTTRQDPRIAAKRRALQALDAEREATVREHQAELDADIAQYNAQQNQLTRLQQTWLPLARQKVDLQMAGYRAGQRDLAAVLATRRELIDAQLRQLDIESRQAALVAKLTLAYEENAQ